MKYNKLVRDNIPEYIQSKGESVSFHVADDKEYWEKLKQKLLEEVKEFQDSESPEELADIWEVIEAIIVFKQFHQEDIATLKEKKAVERGKFQKRIILEES